MGTTDLSELPSGGRLALDIETISPSLSYSDYPDFDNPNHFEFLATAMCYEPPEQENGVAEAILWRDGLDTQSELNHARDVAGIIASLEPSDLVTYNGDRFDLWLLLTRAKQGGKQVGDLDVFKRLQAALDSPNRIDLKHSAWEVYGEYTTLEDTIENQDLSVRRTLFDDYDHGHSLSYRPATEPPYIEGTDVPEIGEALLKTSAGQEESVNVEETRAMLTDYALGDIEHLLDLADRHPF